MNDYQKHIISYLPYRLECKLTGSILNGEVHTLKGMIYEGNYTFGDGGKFGFIQRGVKDFKPLLIPLSKLTEHAAQVMIGRPLKYLLRDIEKRNVSIDVWDELLEEHFDVYGMIEKRQAIEK